MGRPLMKPLLPAAILWIPLLPATAQLAGKFEPFTYQTNAKSWVVYDYADGKLYKPAWDSAGDGLNPDIFFTFAGANALDFYADSLSSGGAFVGNLAAGGVDAVGCDIYVEDINSFNYGEFFLFSAATNKYYVSNFIEPASSGWDFAYASLTEDDWYVFQNGAYVPIRLTPQILGGITEIGITFRPLSTPNPDGKAVGIDNFTFYGALLLPQLTTSAAGGSFQLGFQRRAGVAYSILSSPNLNAWTLVPGQGNITGTTPYTMTRPLTPDPRFFKVGIEDFLTPVPPVVP
jgi:hypothetical protein